MKNIFKTCIVFLSLCMTYSCEDENSHKPYGANNDIPAQVENVSVTNISGGAILKFEIPIDPNILYIEAVYPTSNGDKFVRSASNYSDQIIINGLGDTNEYNVQMYTVSYGEVSSEPINVIIKPLTPSVDLVFNSLKCDIDFGGFIVDFENIEGDNIAIYALQKDSLGNMSYYDALYTSMDGGKYPVRGLKDEESVFGVYVRDQFNNISDTLIFSGTPWREDLIDKKQIKTPAIFGDTPWNAAGGSNAQIFDDIVSGTNFGHIQNPTPFPHRLTIDLGVSAKLSRFKLNQRMSTQTLFRHGTPLHFAIYGKSELGDSPSGDNADPLEDWILFSEFTAMKPSGLPLDQYTTEDWEYAGAGEEYTFPRDIPSVRYLRLVVTESWSGMEVSVIGELTFWGEIEENN